MFNLKPLILTGMAALALSSVFNATSSLATTPVKITYAADTVNAADQVLSGTFSGLSDHETVGAVSIEKTDTGYQLVLAESFKLDGAPDPVIGFGNGEYVKSSQIGKLRNKKGAQTYTLPANFNPASYSQVYIYCEKFSVPLGVAPLK